jgi:tetratricopeptide (TPR) repeat protein
VPVDDSSRLAYHPRMKTLRVRVTVLVVALLSLLPAAAPQQRLPEGAEAVSLFGQPLISRPPTGDALARLEENLAAARKAYEASPSDPEAVIWLGRRTAYFGRFRESIAIYTRGIEKHPRYAKLYRHRGHRYISVREFDKAIADLERAAQLIRGKPDEIEPDGQPNARNTPTSTTQSNIWYHLGLAYYLKGDFKNALRAYRECLKVSKNDDMLAATSHWLYMTLRRLGRDAEAKKTLEPIHEKMDIVENASYHRLLLMYKGVLTPEDVLGKAKEGVDLPTTGYGVANWHFYNGRREPAVELLRAIVSGEQWAAFGYIAAEADLHRLGN